MASTARCFPLGLVLLCVLPGVAPADDCLSYADHLRWVGGVVLPEGSNRVAVSGTHAYVVGTFGLKVVDISDPKAPVVVGGADTPAPGHDIAISGMFAYVADDTSGLQVVDISNPLSPLIVGSVDAEDAESYNGALGVAVAGTHVYVAYGSAGLRIVDVSTPGAPAVVGGVDTPDFALDVAVSGTHAYVADQSSGLQVIDISNPTSPAVVGSLGIEGSARSVTVIGAQAYVGLSSSLQVIDVSNPSEPGAVGSVPVPGEVSDVVVSGTQVYLGWTYGLLVVDATTPSAPVLVGSLPGNFINGLAAEGGIVYATDYFYGFRVADVANPRSLDVAEGLSELFWSSAVAVSGSQAYLAGATNGGTPEVRVADVSDPAMPGLAGSVSLPAGTVAEDLVVSGSHVYVAAGGRGLQVVDVSNPAVPAVVGEAMVNDFATGVAVAGSYAYLAFGSGLQAVDISDPTNPQVVGSPSVAGAWRLVIEGSYAYITTPDTSLDVQVIDITNPALSTVGGVAVPGYASGIAVMGSFVYVGAMTSVYVIDVSDPAHPDVLRAVDMWGRVGAIEIAGSRAYVGVRNGVQVLDLSDPSFPTVLGGLGTGGPLFDLAAFGSHVAVVGAFLGIQVIPAECSTTPVLLASFRAVSRPGGVLLTWTTAEESAFAGFHVLRSRWEDYGYERATSRLIEPPGPYSFLDEDAEPGIRLYYRLEAWDRSGRSERFGPVAAEAAVLSPELGPSYPNPCFGAGATIPLTLARAGEVTLRVLDASGRSVRVLVRGPMNEGLNYVSWDGRNDRGEPVAAGVYVYEAEGPGFREARRLVKLR